MENSTQKLDINQMALFVPNNLFIAKKDKNGVWKKYDKYASVYNNVICLLEYESEDYKPLLYPLHYLYGQSINSGNFTFEYIDYFSEQHYFTETSDTYRYKIPVQNLPYNVVMDLIKQSYDIFGLIEKGLALDATDF